MEELLAMLQANGLTQEQAMAMMQYIMQPAPPVEPFQMGNDFDIGAANKQVDYGRDVNTLLADNMTAAMTGLAGYSGVDAFMPKREYVEGPQNRRLMEYMNKPLDTLEGWLADKITREGASPVTITAEAKAFLDADPAALTPEQMKIRSQLEQFQYQDSYSGEPRYDFGSLEQLASDLEAESFLNADPEANYDPETGQWYKETPSEQAQWYDERGLPLPTMQYELGDFSPQAARADQRLTGAQARQGLRQESGYYDAQDAKVAAAYDRYMQGNPLSADGNRQMAPQSGGEPPLAPLPSGGEPVGVSDVVGQATSRVPGSETIGQAVGSTLPGWIAKSILGSLDGLPGGIGGGSPQPPQVTGARPISREDLELLTASGTFSGGRNNEEMRRQEAAQGRMGARQRDDATNLARNQFLQASRRSGDIMRAGDNRDVWRAQQEANGRRFYGKQADGSWGYGPDTGVAQGKVDFAQAQAQGRTPLSDVLRQRALAAYLMGG